MTRWLDARWLDRGLAIVTGLCAAIACGLLAGILGYILWRSMPVLHLDFLTAPTTSAGAAGGVRYQLLGTLVLLTATLVICLPLAVAIALLKAVYLGQAAARRLGVVLLTLNGVPSILFGLFGLLLFGRLLDWGKSWLAGGILLGMMILPTVAVAFCARLEAVPRGYIEAAAGLGLRRSQIVTSVLLPHAAGGLVSGLLLGLARAAGETAPILFAAAVFSGATLPTGIRESPVLALPYHIFTLAQDAFDPAMHDRLWGSALVLLALVTLFSLAALPARLRLREEAGD